MMEPNDDETIRYYRGWRLEREYVSAWGCECWLAYPPHEATIERLVSLGHDVGFVVEPGEGADLFSRGVLFSRPVDMGPWSYGPDLSIEQCIDIFDAHIEELRQEAMKEALES